MKKVFTATYTTVIVAVGLMGLLFLATLLPIPGNVKIKVVKSGSMEPTIHVGSIVALRPAESYVVGDVITFGEDTKTQIPTTHRIVAVEGSGADTRFTTKGDANDANDPAPTPASKVEGKVFFTLPYAGYALAFARTKLGFFILVGLPALAVFAEEGLSIWREARRIKRRRARIAQQHLPDDDSNTRDTSNSRRLISTLAFIGVVSFVAAGGAGASTLAYYANSETSFGNSMKAGVFDVVAPLFQIFVSDPVVVVASTTPEQDPSIADAPSDATEAPQEDATSTPADPQIEITTSDVTIE